MFQFALMNEANNIRSAQVGFHLESLLYQSGLTVIGLSNAINMSPNHLRAIKNGKASISSRTAGKIADFFMIGVDLLFSTKLIKLKRTELIIPLITFYKENEANQEFFIQRKAQNSIGFFLNNTILPSDYLEVERSVREIKNHILSSYRKDFSSKEISRQLTRLVESGKLQKQSKFGNNSIFLYSKKL